MTNPTESSDESTRITSCVRRVLTVLRSGRFQVPWHQRKYDWSPDEVKDLLQDLHDAVERDKTCYFLGSIMLFESNATDVLRINDGQQRLITISLLIAALCRRFASSNAQVPEYLAVRTLFDTPEDPSIPLEDRYSSEPRIRPPAHDRENYLRILQGGDIRTRGPLESAWRAVDDFVESLEFQNQLRLFTYLDRSVEVSVLDIPTDVDENLVFETLNARGKRLEDVDLIRNHLYSYFPDSEVAARRRTLQENLERPRQVLGTQKLPQYFRSFLQCQYGYLQKARMYRKARARIEEKANRSEPQRYVFGLASDLGRSEHVHLFHKVGWMHPNETLDGNLPRVPGKRHLDVLLGELEKYSVSHPLCFALLRRFLSADTSERQRIRKAVYYSLRNLNAFVMRSVFASAYFRPHLIEEPLADAAKQVFMGETRASLVIVDTLRNCDAFEIFDDRSFVRRLAKAEFRRTRTGRRNQKALDLLFAINAQEQAGSDALDRAGCSAEHVLPESEVHWSSWLGFTDADPAAWVYRLGNMVVLSRNENRGGNQFNSTYNIKRETFRESPINMARRVAREHGEWNPAVITQRSNQLAETAARIWRFWT